MRNFFRKILDKINQALEKMAEENKKSFGGKKMDCCDLNKNK